MKTIAFILVLLFFASCSSVVRVGSKASHPHTNSKHATQVVETHKHSENHDGLKRTIPKGKSGKIISREGYVLQYNKDCKIAHWVSYEILSKNLIGNVDRSEDFGPDELIDSDQANLDDYKYSGYDRGHLARAHIFTRSPKLMSESFRLSNMVPQDPYMNESGAWRRSEDFEYQVAKSTDKILVVSGPILSRTPKVIGHNKVCVPQSLFKVIFNPSTKEGIGFIIPNHKEKNKYQYYVKTIDEVESASGLDFFHELDDSIENEIESEADFSNWNDTSIKTKKYVPVSGSSASSDQKPPYKRSHSGKCHAKDSRYYEQTKHFDSFETLEECQK
jgi:endonuclease G